MSSAPSAPAPDEGKERDLQVGCLALYETPLAVAVLPGMDAVNAALAAAIAEAASLPDGAWQSDWGFGSALSAVAEIAAAAEAFALPMTGGGAEIAQAWSHRCRANFLPGGAGLTVQSHPGAIWAATYIVEDGGADANPAYGAALEFQDPRGAAPVMYAPQLTFAAPGAETLGVSQTLQLAGGGLAVYPAWLLYGIAPYRGPGRHLSLTFTLGPGP